MSTNTDNARGEMELGNEAPATDVSTGEAQGQKFLRLSINPTYDSRETGPRYTIQTFIADRFLDVKPLADPFVRHTIRVSVLDAIWSILRHGSVVVSVNINGHQSIVEDVMELDANYIGHGSTRRAEWTTSIETALREVANDNSVL